MSPYFAEIEAFLRKNHLRIGSMLEFILQDDLKGKAEIVAPLHPEEQSLLNLRERDGTVWGFPLEALISWKEVGYRAPQTLSAPPAPPIPPHPTRLLDAKTHRRALPLVDCGLIGGFRAGRSGLKSSLCEDITGHCETLFEDPPVDQGVGHWRDLATHVASLLAGTTPLEGILISHPRDTLSMSATALAFMLQSLSVPVIFFTTDLPPIMAGAVGSQAREQSFQENLRAAARFARELGCPGVFVCGSTQRKDQHALYWATHVPLDHQEGRAGGPSCSSAPLARLSKGQLQLLQPDLPGPIPPGHRQPLQTKLAFHDTIGLLQAEPGMPIEYLQVALSNGREGLVIACFSETLVPFSWSPLLQQASLAGVAICLVSRSGGQLSLHHSLLGRQLAQAGVLALQGILPHVAMFKLGWLKAQGFIGPQLRLELQRSFVGEISNGALQEDEAVL